MKYCILIVACSLLMCAAVGNASELKTFEQRVIVPYPTGPETTSVPTPRIETMPYVQSPPQLGGLHVRPYLDIGRNPDGRGLGADFGINFGIFRSHGLGFGINLF